MTAAEIVERAKDVVQCESGVVGEKVVPEASFRHDLGCDSLDEVEIVIAIENEFDIDIGDEDAEKMMASFGALTGYLTGRLATDG